MGRRNEGWDEGTRDGTNGRGMWVVEWEGTSDANALPRSVDCGTTEGVTKGNAITQIIHQKLAKLLPNMKQNDAGMSPNNGLN